MSARPQAIVVGGGWAGVAAATELVDRGAHVLLLESRRLWGGRATSWPDPKHGDAVDNGQHVLLGCYTETRQLLRRLGTEHLVEFQDGLDVAFREPGGASSRLAADPRLGRLGLALGLARWSGLPFLERVGLARALASAPPPDPGHTVERWMATLGAGRDACRFFWHPLTEAVINEAPDRAPAALLHEAVRRAFRGKARDAAIGLARAGLAALVAPVVDALAARDSLAFLGHEVAAVAPGPRGGHTVELDDGRRFDADLVVLAVPAAEARTLVAAAHPEVAAELADAAAIPGSPIVTTTLWFDVPVLPARIVGLVAPRDGEGSGFHWAFDRSALVGARANRHAVTLVASAAHALNALPTAQVIERAKGALATYGLTRLEPLAGRVVREPRATPAYDPVTVTARPPVTTRHPGLAVAGDWTASPLPATIEAAVLSGRKAAAVLMARHQPRRTTNA